MIASCVERWVLVFGDGERGRERKKERRKKRGEGVFVEARGASLLRMEGRLWRDWVGGRA